MSWTGLSVVVRLHPSQCHGSDMCLLSVARHIIFSGVILHGHTSGSGSRDLNGKHLMTAPTTRSFPHPLHCSACVLRCASKVSCGMLVAHHCAYITFAS